MRFQDFNSAALRCPRGAGAAKGRLEMLSRFILTLRDDQNSAESITIGSSEAAFAHSFIGSRPHTASA